jgi:hypothetical protein
VRCWTPHRVCPFSRPNPIGHHASRLYPWRTQPHVVIPQPSVKRCRWTGNWVTFEAFESMQFKASPKPRSSVGTAPSGVQGDFGATGEPVEQSIFLVNTIDSQVQSAMSILVGNPGWHFSVPCDTPPVYAGIGRRRRSQPRRQAGSGLLRGTSQGMG